MLSDLLMEKFKKCYKPMAGCYVLPYYGEEFETSFSEDQARQIALATEKIVDEILDMTEDYTLTEEFMDDFEEGVHERHKDSEAYNSSDFSSDDLDVLYIVTDGFYNGGPFQRKAFEEATKMIGRANGDDINSIDWKINLQPLFYSSIYTIMELSLELDEDEIPETCGWQFFCNVINYMSSPGGGMHYHIKTDEDEVFDTLEDFMGGLGKYLINDDGWQFSEEQINMNEELLVISVPRGGSSMDMRFSVPGLYEIYKSGGWNVVHKEISKSRDAVYSVDPDKITELLSTYETAKPQLILRPINYNDNRSKLVNHIYERTGDIAIVLYFIISDHDGQLNTTKVHKDIFNSWNIEKEEVFQDALLNNVSQAQPRIYTDVKDMEKKSVKNGAFMAVDSPVKSLPKRGAMVTTTRKINGAIALFYPGVKEKIGELFGDDYYVVFTATSEAWVHPKSEFSPRNLLPGLKDSNKAFPEEFLTRKIYLYSRAENELKPLEL